jgi:hypothetical protein
VALYGIYQYFRQNPKIGQNFYENGFPRRPGALIYLHMGSYASRITVENSREARVRFQLAPEDFQQFPRIFGRELPKAAKRVLVEYWPSSQGIKGEF